MRILCISPPDGCTGNICLLSVKLCLILHLGIKMKEIFLPSRALNQTDSQPVSSHEFLMKLLMVMAFSTAASEKYDLLVSILIFCCNNSLTHLCTEAKTRFIAPSQTEGKMGF